MLLEPFTENVSNPSDAALQQAVDYSIPPVAPLFGVRLMVVAGFIMLALFMCAFYYSTKHKVTKPRWLLKSALYGLPLPWIACEAGWFVAEYGRQPWSIAEDFRLRLFQTSGKRCGDNSWPTAPSTPACSLLVFT